MELKFLGRNHSPEEAINAISVAAKNFERFSFDLIYALPNQSLEAWKNTLNKAMEIAKQKAKEELKKEMFLESKPDFYDTIQNHDQRIQAIVYELKKLCSLSVDELQTMYTEMQEILDYNFDHFYNNFKDLKGKRKGSWSSGNFIKPLKSKEMTKDLQASWVDGAEKVYIKITRIHFIDQ